MPTAQAKRLLTKHGKDATLRTYTADGSKDEYEDDSTTASSQSIKAIRESRRQQMTLVDERGVERLASVDLYVDSALGVTVRGEPRLPEVDIGSRTYVVVLVDPDNGGLDRLICEQTRTV